MSIDLEKHRTELVLRPDAELVERPRPRAARQTVIGTIVQRPAYVITTLTRHKAVRATGTVTVRAVATTCAGWASFARRGWSAATHGKHRKALRAAEQSNNLELIGQAIDRLEKAKNDRAKRLREWLEIIPGVVRTCLVGAVVGLLGLVVLGVLIQLTPGGWGWDDWWSFLITVAEITGDVLWAVVVAVSWLLVPAALIAGFYEGRRAVVLPHWLMWTAPDKREIIPDEGAILVALRNLGLPKLDRKFKEGWSPRWVMPTTRDGKGYRTQLELPQGVTVRMIADCNEVLAHNLVRLPVESWPTEPKSQPGILDLWVADQGLLTGPVEPYPLLEDGTCDYFTGVPVGIDQRGLGVTGRLMASNYIIAGAMGSGKSTLVIDLLAGAMLDPLADIDVYCMAENVDYDPMRPRLRTFIKGDEEEHVIAAMEGMRALRQEVTLRGKVLAELGGTETKVTRDLAERDPRLRPVVVVFDECQELFRHDKLGDEAKELAIKLVTKARKTAITCVFVTPEPSADSLPREIAKVMSHKVCYAIGDHQGNDAVLGTGMHKRGITAVNLVAGEDIGTAMAIGFTARPGLLRSYWIRKDKTVDELTPIVRRAMALLNGRPVQVQQRPDGEDIDYLTDILTVLDDRPRMGTSDVLKALAQFDPKTYGGWTFGTLAAVPGLKTGKSGGLMVVRRTQVLAALAARDGEAGELDAG